MVRKKYGGQTEKYKNQVFFNRAGPSNGPILSSPGQCYLYFKTHPPPPPPPLPTQRIKLNYCSSSLFIPTPLLPPCRHVKAHRSATSRRCGFVLGHLSLRADPQGPDSFVCLDFSPLQVLL
jgi:hypothetical protein